MGSGAGSARQRDQHLVEECTELVSGAELTASAVHGAGTTRCVPEDGAWCHINSLGGALMYRWLVFLHVLAVFGFLLAHGTAIAVAFRLRREREVARIRVLLDL